MFRRNLFSIIIVLLLSAVSFAGDDGLSLMKIGHSARISGMGEAVTAIANDVNGSAYNPASINGLTKFSASFGHVSYWDNVNQESLYFGKGIRQNLFWHGGIRYAGVDDLKAYDLFPTDEPLAFF